MSKTGILTQLRPRNVSGEMLDLLTHSLTHSIACDPWKRKSYSTKL